MRGLKYYLNSETFYHIKVAPHMGAWIEILKETAQPETVAVAPHMGAWIEIAWLSEQYLSDESHPTWVRGLKS